MPVQSITAEQLGLPGRIRAGRRRSRSTLQRITPEDVWPAPKPPEALTRSVSGDWLASVLGVDKEISARISGREVVVHEEAWFAVQAHLDAPIRWRSRSRKIARRRAEVWPEADPVPPLSPDKAMLLAAPCVCVQSVDGGVRYVDAENGDDGDSGELAWDFGGSTPALGLGPWTTLCKVEAWLNGLAAGGACIKGASVYLRRGRTWSGEEEPGRRAASPCTSSTTPRKVASWEYNLPTNGTTSTSSALTVTGFKATADWPLVLSAYGPKDPNGADNRPLIDGCTQRAAGARYGREEVGLLFFDCCYVRVTDLRIRGFKTAINVRRASKHHVYENVSVYDNARAGFEIGTRDVDLGVNDSTPTAQVAAAIAAGVALGHYPADISVMDCQAESNGYDTEGADIELGFLATNCTISGNVLMGGGTSSITGTAVRGIDGVVSQGGSSGHLIEKNRIGEHRAWCTRSGGSTGADQAQVVKAGGCGSGGEPVIQHPCASSNASCVDLREEYGYWASYNSGTPTGDDPVIGEDGIDLKGVRQRTPDAQKETIVCDNVIWGHTSFGFSGVTVNDGSNDVYIYRNRIFQNSTGIYVGNSGSTAFYVDAENEDRHSTQDVYIYRNLVFMNEQRGIHIESGDLEGRMELPDGSTFKQHRRVRNVWIVNNTIAHNLWTGVNVQSKAGDGDVKGVFLYNNLIARNGIGGGTDVDRSMQVTWSAGVDLLDPAVARSDYNVYLGWDGSADRCILWGDSLVIMPSGYSRESAADRWKIELKGVQVADLIDLHLIGGVDLYAKEGRAGADLSNSITTSLPSTLESLDYDIGSRTSALSRAGLPAVGVIQPDSVSDLVHCEDLNGDSPSISSPSVGAYEGPG